MNHADECMGAGEEGSRLHRSDEPVVLKDSPAPPKQLRLIL
jgi:hypothetical protein